MCSVVGCCSWRRTVQRFKLPEDPERRLEWVQFLAKVNKQRFKESSWTDISICRDHFEDACFESVMTVLSASESGVTGKVQLTLKPGAVPSLHPWSEPRKPKPDVNRPKCEESAKDKVACQSDELKTDDGPTSSTKESRLTLTAAEGSPVHSTNTSDPPVSDQMHPKSAPIDMMREKAALLQKKGRYVVNEKRLLQLFNCKCPLCGSNVSVEKVTNGTLLILNKQCLQCEYRKQWKSQINTAVPAAGEQHLTPGTDVTPGTSQAEPVDDTQSSSPQTEVPEIVAVIGEESDSMDETDGSGDQEDVDSDEDWRPARPFLPAGEVQKKPDYQTKEEREKSDDSPPPAPKHSELCTDCGLFFNTQKPHTCEHKIKPFSCIICGKRCISEFTLSVHSRIHDENYEHRCKYCHVAFKLKVDKYKHEETHMIQGRPYKCPDCPKTFATNKERRIHLESHRGRKCNYCGIEFLSSLSLQRHLPVHTGEKPFKCSVCHRGFNQASHLKSHMRLHTGERPYKCQHCDKRFNHNVSLKSHVQRYHTSDPRQEPKKEKAAEKKKDTGELEGNGDTKGKGSEDNNTDEERDTEEEVEKVRADMLKMKKRSTGRPIGRPKRNAAGQLVVAVQVEGQCSNSKTRKHQAARLKTTPCSDEGNDDEQSDSNTSLNMEDNEEEGSEQMTSSTSRSRGKTKNSDSDSDFNPGERKKRRYSRQKRGKGSGKRRGRQKTNLCEDS